AAVSAAVAIYAKARALPIYSVERKDMKISITFDCAWGTDFTDKILTCMAQNDIKCTFFAVEFWVEKNPEFAKRIVEEGHELGTHSKTHAYMSKQSEGEIREELRSSSQTIERVTGKKCELFRAPYGDYNDRLINTAKSEGLFTVQWDVDSLDWKNLSSSEIAERIIDGVQPGSIILCHNNGLHTAAALPQVFRVLKARGYQFVPVGELIYRSGYTIDVAGRQKPADS
ncbi:MAG: polysaccharide deacetylase family protein, partial [Clostridia bacterium]|nr:polysaccharide deacetylase family protein [Clostridia bacterium]